MSEKYSLRDEEEQASVILLMTRFCKSFFGICRLPSLLAGGLDVIKCL